MNPVLEVHCTDAEALMNDRLSLRQQRNPRMKLSDPQSEFFWSSDMNPIQPPSTTDQRAAGPALRSRKTRPTERPSATALSGKPRGYGLPCATCRAYYPADLEACPICRSSTRIQPRATAVPVNPVAPLLSAEDTPDPDVLEQERERFLREFKSQVFAAHAQINVAESFRCSLEENHPGVFEPAEVCRICYGHLQDRVDLVEAALHMELKEATQIIYDAVWADTSDTSKTYENAAQALLAEIRKRAGIPPILGPLQILPH